MLARADRKDLWAGSEVGEAGKLPARSGLKVASLFAGIGGFDKAFEDTGAKVVAQCEIDPFCRGVLKRH
jgi:hypothetical protein